MTSKQIMVKWIQENTINARCIVDFGCMFGSRLKYSGNASTIKIGIELFKPYLEHATEKFIKIHGDMCNFEQLVDSKYYDYAMLIDTIEHIEKEKGNILLKSIQKYFNKILLITPEGYFKFDKDLSKFGSHETQRHKCGWNVTELENLGFTVSVIKDFQPPNVENRSCIFAIWEK